MEVLVDDGERHSCVLGRGEKIGQWGVRANGKDAAGLDDSSNAAIATTSSLDDFLVTDHAEQTAVLVNDEDARPVVLVHDALDLARICRLGDDGLCRAHDRRCREHSAAVDILDEVSDVVVGRLGEDLVRGADLGDTTIAHDRDVIAEVHGLVEVVGDEDDRLIEGALQLEELVLHLTTDQWVKSGEGLVHEQDVSLRSESPSQTDALLHTAGQLVGILVSPSLEPHGVQPLVGFLQTVLRLELALQLQPVGRVLANSQVRKKGEMLEHHRHMVATKLPQLGVVHVRDNFSGHLDGTLGGRPQPVDHPDERGLSGP